MKCGAWKGQLGLEPTPFLYVEHVVMVFKEIKRVLKKTGSVYVVLGDTYAGSCSQGSQSKSQPYLRLYPQRKVLQPKCLIGIPWRVALTLIDENWVLRNAIIWHKPNAMPSSVKDRLTCTYETIFHFVKNRKYYYDLDAIREPHSTGTFKRILQKNVFQQNGGKKQVKLRGKKRSPRDRGSRCSDMVKSIAEKYVKHDLAVRRVGNFNYSDPLHTKECHPKGKNPGDIIRIGIHHGSSLTSGRATHHEGQIIENHLLGKNPGDVIHLDREKTAVEDFRTGRSMKLPPEPQNPNAFHPKGKNPGDIIKTRQDSSEIMAQSRTHRYHSRTGIHQEGINLGRYRYAKNGKNPGDVIKQVDEMMKKHPTNPPHHAPRIRLSDWNPHKWMQHPLGKNPGDIVLERGFKGGKVEIKGDWLNDICPNCGRTYRRHFGIQSGRTTFIPCSMEGSNPGDFWSISTKPFKGSHFAVYPEEICIKPIKSSCPPDGIVLDPMCGSGTTLVVTKKLGRNYIGFEINPNYVEMAKKRLSEISTK